jgi:hypothetical protein
MSLKTLPLFDESPEALSWIPARPEPLFWLKEVRLLHSLGEDAELIRDPITFRRGLNIIATTENTGTSEGGIGHNVGKSTLMRLIRYCLGEVSFAEKLVRQAICDLFPNGYIVATFEVGTDTWFVARPIGLYTSQSQSFASKISIKSLADRELREPYANFLQTMERIVIAPLPQTKLPMSKRELRWVDVIGWLAPDQKCAHKSHVNWRPGGAELLQRGLSIEDNHILVRTVMDLLNAEDSGLIESHKTLLSERGKLARQIDLKRAVQAESLQELLGLLPEGLREFEGELIAAQAITYASTRRLKAETSLANEMSLDSLHDWRKSNNELQQNIGRLLAKIGHEETDIKEAEMFLKSVDDGSYKRQLLANADMGVFCHLFNTKSEAISKGCPGSTARIAPKYDPDLERMKAEKQSIIDACQSRLNSLRMELAQKESLVAKSEAEYTEAQTAAEAVRQPLRDTINEMRILEITAKRYQRVCEERSQLVNSQDALPASIRASLEQRRKADLRYKKNRKTITECFIEALFRTTGSRFEASIEINANGIHPRLGAGFQSSGEAMGTSTILAFDLACMMASMRSIGNHPRFLLDDSPRDADIEPQLYQRFLQSIADLEQLTPDSDAAFQYILTTTTRPEGALAEEPYLRLTLDRIKPVNMLFGVRF